MFDEAEYRRWRDEAEGAARGAHIQGEAGLHNWACFLAEQAAQLAVKGLLHGVGRGAWGHDLVVLGERLEEAVGRSNPASLSAALQRLSRHYIPARYPDAHPGGTPAEHYGPEDVAQALDDMRSVLDHVDELWSSLGGAEST